MDSNIEARPLDDGGQAEQRLNRADNEPSFREATVPTWRFWLLSVGVSMGLFLSMMDTSIVATCLVTIGLEFHMLNSMNWVALTYSVAYLGCAVVFSRLADVIGRRHAFVAAYVLFFAFSLACGFAKSDIQLFVFRAIQGIGGSGLYSLTMIILPELSPPQQRQHIGALIGMVVALAGVLGPVVGGILTTYTTWSGPIGAVSMAIFFFAWPKSEHLPTIEKRSWKELDYLGSLLTIASAALVVFAFQNSGSQGGIWSHPVFIAPLVVGLLGWISLIAWQFYIERFLQSSLAPAFPISIFRNRVYTSGTISTLLLGFPYLMLIYAIPVRIQIVGGRSSLIAGLMLLPMLGTVAVGSILSGKINSTKNHIFECLLAGSCFMLIGCALLTTLSLEELDSGKLLGFITFVGLGFGLTVSASTQLTGIEVPIREFAPAQGIISQLRILGGSLGIATWTALLQDKRKPLNNILSPLQLMTISPDSHFTATQWRAVRHAYSDAFRVTLIIATCISAMAVVVTLGAYQRQRLDVTEQRQERITEEVARRQRLVANPRTPSSMNNAARNVEKRTQPGGDMSQ
ncbi:hypothetical protein G7046_g3916 [Stylonectria norvegica]|nr:hypothetical protein G7046_g3916 [Stylonectria norvegica]